MHSRIFLAFLVSIVTLAAIARADVCPPANSEAIQVNGRAGHFVNQWIQLWAPENAPADPLKGTYTGKTEDGLTVMAMDIYAVKNTYIQAIGNTQGQGRHFMLKVKTGTDYNYYYSAPKNAICFIPYFKGKKPDYTVAIEVKPN